MCIVITQLENGIYSYDPSYQYPQSVCGRANRRTRKSQVARSKFFFFRWWLSPAKKHTVEIRRIIGNKFDHRASTPAFSVQQRERQHDYHHLKGATIHPIFTIVDIKVSENSFGILKTRISFMYIYICIHIHWLYFACWSNEWGGVNLVGDNSLTTCLLRHPISSQGHETYFQDEHWGEILLYITQQNIYYGLLGIYRRRS